VFSTLVQALQNLYSSVRLRSAPPTYSCCKLSAMSLVGWQITRFGHPRSVRQTTIAPFFLLVLEFFTGTKAIRTRMAGTVLGFFLYYSSYTRR